MNSILDREMADTHSSVVKVVLEVASLVFRQQVRAEDSFLELGIDSLSIVEYCRRLEARLGVDVDIEALFAAETLASFGTALARRVCIGEAQ